MSSTNKREAYFTTALQLNLERPPLWSVPRGANVRQYEHTFRWLFLVLVNSVSTDVPTVDKAKVIS